MKKMMLDVTYTIYPGDQSQLDYMLSRFELSRYTHSLSSITTEYAYVEGKRYFKNTVRKYSRVEFVDGTENELAG